MTEFTHNGFVVHLTEPLTPEEQEVIKKMLDGIRAKREKDEKAGNKHLCEAPEPMTDAEAAHWAKRL